LTIGIFFTFISVMEGGPGNHKSSLVMILWAQN